VRRELFAPSQGRVKKILRYSICLEVVIYLVMGLFGYLSLGDHGLVDLFVLRPAVGETDYCMTVAFFLL
jgi:amino acid permease